MSDAELIAQLRRGWTTLDYVAADRIQGLAALHQAAVQDTLAAEAYAEELEAKIVKAVAFAEIVERTGHGELEFLAGDMLAELKGQNDE